MSQKQVTIDIETGVITGKFPRRALSAVMEWHQLHKDELMTNWEAARNRKPLSKIEPLEQAMFIHVTNAKYMGDYQIWLSFNDGTEGKVDLGPELHGEVFELLKDKEFFRSFSLEGHTLSWSNGADFAPEFLREQIDTR